MRSDGRNRGGKMPTLSRNISPSAAIAHVLRLGLFRDAARNAGPRAILNPLIAASVMARSNGVFRLDMVLLLVSGLGLVFGQHRHTESTSDARTVPRTGIIQPDRGPCAYLRF